MGHAERKHSVLSPSGAHRWLYCTPSALLEQEFPDTGSEAAQEGTLAHELAELKLKNYVNTVDFGKTKFTRAVNKLKKDPLWKDEMQGHTEDYLDYVKNLALSAVSLPTVVIEKRVDLSTWIPSLPDTDPASGTADCILIGNGCLDVIDFKYGKGVEVSAERNPQLSLYALGAYEAYKFLYRIERVYLHIVQPRINNFSSWDCSLEELLEFGKYVQKKAALAIKGEGKFCPGETTCRFCRAKGRCRARADRNVELAFAVGKKPPLITNAEMGEYLEKGSDVEKWLNDLKELALKECLAGKDVPGWKAVEGRGTRSWTDQDKAFEAVKKAGIDETMLYVKNPLSLAKVEELMGKKAFAASVGNYVIKSPGKPTLAKASDNREAITNKVTAKEVFKEETNNE